MGSSVKKTYTPSFKVKVVKYAKQQENISKASREFEVSYNTVRNWISDFDNNEIKEPK